jgi:hypothetical protein
MMKNNRLKSLAFLISIFALGVATAGEEKTALAIGYTVTVSEHGAKNSYLLTSVSDAKQPSITSNTIETPYIKSCHGDSQEPTFDKVSAGDVVSLRPTGTVLNGKVMTAFSYSVVRLNELKPSPATKGGCIEEVAAIAKAEGSGVVLIGADPVVLRDDPDGLRVTVSIAK